MEDVSNELGYSKLIGRSKKKDNASKSFTARAAQFHNISPPVDVCNIIYLSFVLGGMGFLLPYNSFIMAMDYFKVRYPGTPVVFDMSLIYIVVALLTVLGNNLLVETFSLNSRINFGYIMSFITLIFVISCEVSWEAFGSATSYIVNLAAVAVVAVGCTVQQSSFYGYTSMLPPKYTQAVMVGESTSGVFTSVVRVVTKCIVNELRGSTVYFFTVSVSTVLTCFAMYHLIRRSDFIQFYIALCERSKSTITLEPQEDAGLIDPNDTQYGILKIQSSPPPTSTTAPLSFANPAYEPSATAPTYKVEDVVLTRGRHQSISTGSVRLGSFKKGLQDRWEVTKCTWPYMLAIALVYFETLCIYPGVASEVVSCSLGDWMPILMMALFNMFDLIGKMITHYSRNWTGSRLLKMSIARLALVPMLVLCVTPRSNPTFGFGEFKPFLLSVTLGLSNGILGSAPMIQAPFKVEDRHRELTGNMMTLMYMVGLTIGSLVAYSIENAIGPIEDHPCAFIPPMKIAPLASFNSSAPAILNSTSVAHLSAQTTSTFMSVITSTFLGVSTAVPPMRVFGDGNVSTTETSLI